MPAEMISGEGRGDRFFSRVLSKESLPAIPSFRVYYGVASGAVPFFWESQPGTPKHTMAATSLPPLTPPPSYYTSANKPNKCHAKSPKHNLIHAILPRLAFRKRHRPSPPSPPTPSFSFSSTSPRSHRRGRSSSAVSSFSSNSRTDDEGHDEGLSPTSTLCFGERLTAMAGVKKALLSIVGHGSVHGSGQWAAA